VLKAGGKGGSGVDKVLYFQARGLTVTIMRKSGEEPPRRVEKRGTLKAATANGW